MTVPPHKNCVSFGRITKEGLQNTVVNTSTTYRHRMDVGRSSRNQDPPPQCQHDTIHCSSSHHPILEVMLLFLLVLDQLVRRRQHHHHATPKRLSSFITFPLLWVVCSLEEKGKKVRLEPKKTVSVWYRRDPARGMMIELSSFCMTGYRRPSIPPTTYSFPSCHVTWTFFSQDPTRSRCVRRHTHPPHSRGSKSKIF
jgi:hypothetical protein